MGKRRKDRKETAIHAAYAAGEILRQHLRHSLEVAYKSKVDLVTSADQAAEAVILKIIHENYPGEAILSEESTGQPFTGSGWMVDPLGWAVALGRCCWCSASAGGWGAGNNLWRLSVFSQQFVYSCQQR